MRAKLASREAVHFKYHPIVRAAARYASGTNDIGLAAHVIERYGNR